MTLKGMSNIFLENLKTSWNIVKDNIRDKLLHVMETIIARLDAEFPIFLRDVDIALKMSF
jgi:hypothetical protein